MRRYRLSDPLDLDLDLMDLSDLPADPSEEDLKSFVNGIVTFVELACGRQATMVKWIEEHQDAYNNLDPYKLIRTCLVKDVESVMDVLRLINKQLLDMRNGKAANFDDIINQGGEDIGLSINEAGTITCENFKKGHWGAGKMMPNVSSPMTFKKTIEEFGWDGTASSMASDLVKIINETNKSRLSDSISRHFADIRRVTSGFNNKLGVMAGKKKLIIDMKHLIGVKDTLAKFVFWQLKKVASAKKKEKEN